jgi:hypothetical protein
MRGRVISSAIPSMKRLWKPAARGSIGSAPAGVWRRVPRRAERSTHIFFYKYLSTCEYTKFALFMKLRIADSGFAIAQDRVRQSRRGKLKARSCFSLMLSLQADTLQSEI